MSDKLSPKEIIYDDRKISLLIRPLRKEDAPIITTAVQESLDSLLPFMDWAHGELSEENQLNRIVASNQNYLDGKEYDFAVFDGSGNFVVSASWHPSRTRNKKCLEVGYWTHAKHANKGLATLVTKILIFAAFEFMGCDRVEIVCNKANNPSKKVIEKCGFIYEGEIRNFFPEPTVEMLRNNYSPVRTCLMYGLIVEDLPNLKWYSGIGEHIRFVK